ncbi:high frequency lysogenization protein HflD [Spongorhabdus nitratireducens]
MQYTTKDQVTALSGVFQAASLIDQIAVHGTAESEPLETIIQSLFITSPDTVVDVYGNYGKLSTGRQVIKDVFTHRNKPTSGRVAGYALGMTHLERRLARRPEVLGVISQRLERSKDQAEHFGATHEVVISSLASTYLDTMSSFKSRIQVTGDRRNLQVPANANKIRALIFAGIRSAILWRQTGGSRLHLLISRKRLLEGLNQM